MKYDAAARLREQIGILVGLLASEYESTRKLAIIELSEFGEPAVPYLSSALKDNLETPPHRTGTGRTAEDAYSDLVDGIAESLGIISATSSVPILKQLLPRLSAVEALAKIDSSEAFSSIINSVSQWYNWRYPKSERWSRGQDMADFTKKIAKYLDDQEVVSLYRALAEGSLSRESVDERRTNFKIICEALGELGGAGMIPELMKGLEVKDVEVILASLQILRKRGVEIPEKALLNELEVAYNHYSLEGEKKTKARLEGYEQHLGNLALETFEDAVMDMCKTEALIQFLLSHDFEKRWVKDSFLQKAAEWKIAIDPSAAMPVLLKSLQTGSASRQAYAARLIAQAKNPTGEKPKPQSNWR